MPKDSGPSFGLKVAIHTRCNLRLDACAPFSKTTVLPLPGVATQAPKFEALDLESCSGRYHTVTCLDVMIHYPQVQGRWEVAWVVQLRGCWSGLVFLYRW